MNRMVSCIVPVYNGEKWIEKCVDSLIHQTYRNLEILLINDGSTDSSESICLKMQQRDSRIRYCTHPNQGVSHTRNRGIRLSLGEYLCFVDCDDTLEKTAVQTLVELMEQEDAQLAAGAIETVSKYGTVHFRCGGCVLRVDTPGENLLKFIFEMRSPSGYMAAKLFRSQIVKENSLLFDPDIRCYEDAIFTYRYLKFCQKCAVTDKTVYYYNRSNATAATRAYHENRYVWECLKIACQKQLFCDVSLSRRSIAYVNTMILRQFSGMCSYYIRHAPNPEGIIPQIQSSYAALLIPAGECDESSRDLRNMLDMPPDHVIRKISSQTKKLTLPQKLFRLLQRFFR